MSNTKHSDGTVTLGRPAKLPPGTRVSHNGDAGTIVEPADWSVFDDEYRVQFDAVPGGYTRDWVLRADELTVLQGCTHYMGRCDHLVCDKDR